MTVDATRPISVNNCANRIVARAAALKVTPLVQDRLHPNQVGCVAGRSSAEDLRGMADEFHNRVQRGDPYYLLLLDFQKAFDSIQHEFILAAAMHKGMPPWFINLLKGLFQGATATPVLGNQRGSLAIHLFIGVKQGCALSVIAFLLTIDILLWRLHPDPGTNLNLRSLAYVDDISAGVTDINKLAHFMQTTNDFTATSKMKVNVKKTQLLTSKPLSTRDRQWLSACPWPQLSTPPQGKLLGLIIGRDVNAPIVFRDAFKKYYNRLRTYGPAIRNLPGHLRSLAYNVFILPVLGYLLEFYLPWYSYTGPKDPATMTVARDEVRRAIIPFNGTAFSYAAAIAPAGLAQPHPIRDLWAWYLATQGSLCSSDEIELGDGQDAPLPPPDAPPPIMTSSAHRAEAMREIRYRVTQVAEGNVYDAAPLLDAHAKGRPEFRRFLYRNLVDAYLIDNGEKGANRTKYLHTVFRRRNIRLAGSPLEALDANMQALRLLLPAKYMHSHFLAVHNGHVTTSRLIPITNKPADVCQVCRKAESVDRAAHMLVDCPVVRSARDHLLRWGGCSSMTNEPDSTRTAMIYLCHKYTTKPTLTAAIHLLVNYASWVLSRRVLPAHWSPDWRENAAIITEYVASILLRCADKAKWTLVPRKGLGLQAGLQTTRLQSRRSAEHRKSIADKKSRAAKDRLVRRKRPFLHIGTDGSARPTNPGPNGAGVVIEEYDNRGRIRRTTTTYEGLGTGSNNEGELYALGMAATHVLTKCTHLGPHTPILIVSDSQLAIGLTRYRQRPKAPDTRALAHSVRPLFDKLRARFPLTLILWAPSHRNNPINDAADTAANKGAALSKAGKGLGAEAKEWKIQHGIFAPRPNRS